MSGSVKTFFTRNWPKKVLSILLAVIIWSLINKSLSTNKIVNNVAVRVKNVPSDKALSQANLDHILNKRVKVNLQGYKGSLDTLSADDFEIVIDAQGKPYEWTEVISKYHLRSTNPAVNLKQVSSISTDTIDVKMTNLASAKIPVMVTHSMGNAPVGYEFLNIWPNKLYVSVTGPEEVLKKLKSRGYNLTFNLANIPKDELSKLVSVTPGGTVNYLIPDEYKQIFLPEISAAPIQINDPRAKELRVGLLKEEFLQLPSKLPISVHAAPEAMLSSAPQHFAIKNSPLVKTHKGVPVITKPLLVKGVSRHFLNIVKNHIQLLVSINDEEGASLSTSIQFIDPKVLEDNFISYCMENHVCNYLERLSPLLARDYLRKRFKTYMANMQLFYDKNHKLELAPCIENNMIVLNETGYEN